MLLKETRRIENITIILNVCNVLIQNHFMKFCNYENNQIWNEIVYSNGTCKLPIELMQIVWEILLVEFLL